MSTELPPRYSPADTEPAMTALWEKGGYFHADPDRPGDAYAIVIPPPNVTARLHVGHALNNTLQDVLIRYHRMQGDNTIWMPGTDHAGIATQTVVDKRLRSNGEPALPEYRQMEEAGQNGREQFVAKVMAWKDEYEATITEQLKLMGCSCDWDRQRFTMDDICARSVRETFFRLFKDGLIYRGKRLVNWDPATQTVLADDEVEHEDVDGHFWYMKYPLEEPVTAGGKTINHVTVATTRPETMLGDTAVAMNPSDPRAGALVGKQVRLPIVGRLIAIVADDHVVLPDPESEDEKARFSTGFLKVTPAHDPDDYAIGQRHDLPIVNVMAPDATISDQHGWDDADEAAEALPGLLGMDRFEARKAIVSWFREHELLEDVRDYTHPVGHSYRSHVPIEPYLSDQWYIAVKKPIAECGVRNAASGLRERGLVEERGGVEWIKDADVPVNSLAGFALAPLLDGRLRFVPERYAKTYQSWLENLRDWPISRQLWWGHRIPIWRAEASEIQKDFGLKRNKGADSALFPLKWSYGGFDLKVQVRYEDGVDYNYACVPPGYEDIEQRLEKSGWQRDPDVLDTWFSSALWPFSTMGWPEETPELGRYFPGNVLCTAREIITLWVSRMVMMGQYCAGDVPFPDVFIHAMIQDGEGQKMSKSLGNGVDPLDIIHSHGADAMRFTLVSMTTQTQDVRMPVDVVCPHCGEEFEPKLITTPAGHHVMAPTQVCPKEKSKKMVTSYGLASGTATPTDEMPLARNTSPKFDYGRNFCNKLWNAARFVLMNLAGGAPTVDSATLAFEDRWILTRRNRTIEAVSSAIGEYRYNEAAQAVYDFTWRDFCDWYVEIVKARLGGKSDAAASAAQAAATVALTLDTILRLLHPMMPFVTEALWQVLNETVPVRGIGEAEPASDCIIVAPWPDPAAELDAPQIEADMLVVQDVIRAIRNIRSKVAPTARQPLSVLVSSGDASVRAAVETNSGFIQHLAMVSDLTVGEGLERPAQAAAEVVGAAEVFVRLEGLVDFEAERERLSKQLGQVRDKLAKSEAKLRNEKFTGKAPEHVVAAEREKAADLRAQAGALERNLADLG
jgi:valyl-tRNA synthetase